jgi:hypothetical protein
MIGLHATSSTPTLDAWRTKLVTYPDRAATRIADRMQARARDLAPKDTEAMAQSTSVISRLRNDYALNAEGAHELNADAALFPAPATPGPGEAVVTVGVTYGAFVNDGTIHQAAQPFWDTARLETEATLLADAEAEWGV